MSRGEISLIYLKQSPFIFIIYFIFFSFLIVLGLRCYSDFPLAVQSGGHSLTALCRCLLFQSTGSLAHRLSSCGPKLSCSVAVGSFRTKPNLCPLHGQVDSLSLPGESQFMSSERQVNILAGDNF